MLESALVLNHVLAIHLRGNSQYLTDLGVSLDPFHDAHPLSTECARFLNPAGWHCTMVWAAYMGLPLSLADTGAVLGLERQKLSEGKDLIRYFCKPCEPTKTNGGRTRNRPGDAPEKWALFKSYNLRDVETELEIEKRLSKFPVPEDVWDQYHIDQEINDRGIAIDDALVENAIRMDARSRAELTEMMQKLTNLDNPNSVQQMKQWLINNGMEIDSLGKDKYAAIRRERQEAERAAAAEAIVETPAPTTEAKPSAVAPEKEVAVNE